MLTTLLKSRGFEVETEQPEDTSVLTAPVCDLLEDYETYRFTTAIVGDKAKVILTDRLRLSEQIVIELFVVAKQLRAHCISASGDFTITLIEDVTSIV